MKNVAFGDSGAHPSGGRQIQPWCFNKLNLVESLSCRTVKQNRVSLCFPNGRKPDCPRTVQAKVNPARPVRANQDTLGEWEGADFKLIMLA
jgi:hypothetical protein